MRRSRLQAICNMTWGARYSGAPRPTNERAEVSGYQPARTDPPLLGRGEGRGALSPLNSRLAGKQGAVCEQDVEINVDSTLTSTLSD